MKNAVTLVIGCCMALFELSALGSVKIPGQRAGQAAVVAPKVEVAMCKARQRLQEVIGEIPPGTSVHYATAGDWSTHDLVLYLAERTGPAHLAIATWSISEPAVRQIIRALGDGRLLSLGLLADWRIQTHCPEAMQLAQASATTCRLTSIHAKVAVLTGRTSQLCIVTSANLTNNPRIEAGVITADAAAAEFHRSWIEAELRNASPFDMAAGHARAGGDDE